jgi:cyanophycinase
MGDVFLIGGGQQEPAMIANYAEFLAASPAAAPHVACVIVDEGVGKDWFPRYDGLLRRAGPCEPVEVRVSVERGLDLSRLDDCDALLVCGGLTPLYANAIVPNAAGIREWLDSGGRPYCGFSAGAQIAAQRALVGGWRLDGVAVCHEDCAEDLDELSVVDGLGLVPFAVEVHCAQWGTLSRISAAVAVGQVGAAVAIDEDTMLSIDGRPGVSGPGRIWTVVADRYGLAVSPVTAGMPVRLPGR